MTDNQAHLEIYLCNNCAGKTAAATRDELRFILQCDDRTLRSAIAEARMAGTPIAARKEAPGGYFIPQTREEAMEAINDFRQRASKLCMAAAGVARGMRQLFPDDQQLELKLGDIVAEAERQNPNEEARAS